MNTIVVVGVGALGSHVVQLLRNVDCKIKVVDFDRVEQRNVSAQFHAKGAVGKLKVQGLQQTMKFLFGRRIEAVSHKLVNDNIDELLNGAMVIVDCVDNGDTRRLIQGHARKRNIACVHGALAADGSFGRVVWDEHFQVDDTPVDGAVTCEDGEHLPFIAIVSAYLAQSTIRYLKDKEQIGFQIHPGGVDAT